MRGAVSSLSSRALIFQVPYVHAFSYVGGLRSCPTMHVYVHSRIRVDSRWKVPAYGSRLSQRLSFVLYTRNARNEPTIVPIEQSIFRHVTLGYVICVALTSHWNPLTRSNYVSRKRRNNFSFRNLCVFLRSSPRFPSKEMCRSRGNSIFPRAANHWKENVQRECKVAHNGRARDYRPSF